jgi:SAM-dependent methyltransferase
MNPTARFIGRAALYARHRPGYPEEIIAELREKGLPDGGRVADVGAGTGISSEYFLRHGCRVTAVEPNEEMRRAAEEWLGGRPGFEAVNGTAEETGLLSGAFDLAAAFQAAHWFDFDRALAEMRRLVRPGGLLAMAWNLRSKELTAFDTGLERLLYDRAVDYANYEERRGASIASLSGFETRVFRHEQPRDWEALRGLVQSWSYVPAPGHARHEWFFEGLRRLFEANAEGGVIRLRYDCHFYFRREPR